MQLSSCPLPTYSMDILDLFHAAGTDKLQVFADSCFFWHHVNFLPDTAEPIYLEHPGEQIHVASEVSSAEKNLSVGFCSWFFFVSCRFYQDVSLVCVHRSAAAVCQLLGWLWGKNTFVLFLHPPQHIQRLSNLNWLNLKKRFVPSHTPFIRNMFFFCFVSFVLFLALKHWQFFKRKLFDDWRV